MSKARLTALTFVLILGGLWFFLPVRKPAHSSLTNESQSESGDSTSEALHDSASASSRVDSRSRKVAQQTAPQASGTSTDGAQAPGEAALRALQAESVRPWTARRSGFGNGIKTLVRGLWTTGNGSDIQGSATAFVHDYSESLFGVPAEQVRYAKSETTDRTKVVYDQFVNDMRVYGSTLTLFFEDGGLSRVQNDLVAKTPTRNEPPTGFTAADAFAQFNARESSAYTLMSRAPDTVLFPGPTSLVYAYDFSVRENQTGKTYRVLYDAEAQALIKKLPTQVQ